MKKLGICIKCDFKILAVHFKQIVAFIMLAAILCISIGMMGQEMLYKNKMIQPFEVAVVDNENSNWTHLIISTVQQMKNISELCTIQVLDAKAAEEKLEHKEVAAIIMIPEGFVDSVMTGENKALTIKRPQGTMLEGTIVQELIAAATKLLSSAQAGIYATMDYYAQYNDDDGAHEQELLEEINIVFANQMLARGEIFREVELSATHELNSGQHYILVGLIVLMGLSLMIQMSVIEPITKDEMLMRYKLAGFKSTEIILGKAISLTVFNLLFEGVILTLLFVLQRVLLFDMHLTFSVQAIIGSAFAALGLSSLGLLIGLAFPEKQSYGLFIFVLELIMAFFSGELIPKAFLPKAVTHLGVLTYNQHAYSLLESLFGIQIQRTAFFGMLGVVAVSNAASIWLLKRKGLCI